MGQKTDLLLALECAQLRQGPDAVKCVQEQQLMPKSPACLIACGAANEPRCITPTVRIPGFRWSPWLIRRAVVNSKQHGASLRPARQRDQPVADGLFA